MIAGFRIPYIDIIPDHGKDIISCAIRIIPDYKISLAGKGSVNWRSRIFSTLIEVGAIAIIVRSVKALG